MPYTDPKTGDLYPSEEYYTAKQKVIASGETPTTSNMKEAMSGDFKPGHESIEGTMVTPDTAGDELSLPAGGQVDQLTAIRTLMRQIANDAQETGIGEGLRGSVKSLKEHGMGIESASGASIAQLINYVEGKVVDPIQEKFKTMEDVLKSMQTNAQLNLKTLIETGAIANLDDDALQGLTVTGYNMETLKQIRNTQKANTGATEQYLEGIYKGTIDINDVPAAVRTDVISQIDWDKVPGTTGGAMFELNTGEIVDITTSEGLKRLGELGYTYKQAYDALFANTSLTDAAINRMLGQTDLSKEENYELDTIRSMLRSLSSDADFSPKTTQHYIDAMSLQKDPPPTEKDKENLKKILGELVEEGDVKISE